MTLTNIMHNTRLSFLRESPSCGDKEFEITGIEHDGFLQQKSTNVQMNQDMICIGRATLPSPGVMVSISTPMFDLRQPGWTRLLLSSRALSCLGDATSRSNQCCQIGPDFRLKLATLGCSALQTRLPYWAGNLAQFGNTGSKEKGNVSHVTCKSTGGRIYHGPIKGRVAGFIFQRICAICWPKLHWNDWNPWE